MRGVPGIDYLDDNAEEALRIAPVLARRCSECPFTAGTEANCDPVTKPLSQECVRARHAFWCHKSGDWWLHSHLCAGWAESIGVTLKPSI